MANVIGNITEEWPHIKSSHLFDGENAVVLIVVVDLDQVAGFQNRRPIDPLESEWSPSSGTVESDGVIELNQVSVRHCHVHI